MYNDTAAMFVHIDYIHWDTILQGILNEWIGWIRQYFQETGHTMPIYTVGL